MERNLRNQLALLNTDREFREWKRQCRECVKILRDANRSAPVGTRQRHYAEIARIKCMLTVAERTRGSVKYGSGERGRMQWEELETAFRSRIVSGVVINVNYLDPSLFLKDAVNIVRTRVDKLFNRFTAVKINCTFTGEFVAKDVCEVKTVSTKNSVVFKSDNFDEWYTERVLEPLLERLEEFQERDSGWALSRILNLIVNINKYDPMHAGCYLKLSKIIENKKAVVNVQNDDDACFAWAVVAALFPVTNHANRVYSYPHYRSVLNVNNLTFPMTLNQVRKFETDNDISINIFTTEEEDENKKKKKREQRIVPLQLTKEKQQRHVNLLLVMDDDGEAHFAWIKNLSRLVHCQLSRSKNKQFICDRCLHYFYSEEKLTRHLDDCQKMNDVRVILPDKEEDRWIQFKNYKNSELVPFVVYADIECLLKKVTRNRTNDANTFAYQEHVPFSVGYYVKSSRDNSLDRYSAYRGVDCVEWLARELENIARLVSGRLRDNEPMIRLSKDELSRHRTDPNCHICRKPFLSDDMRVRDHDHITGKYRGPAHNRCNLNFKDTTTIPVIFHNLSGYDAHFIIEAVANSFEGSVQLLPINKEKYISFTKNVDEYSVKFRFIDSFKFLASSLDKLSSYLETSKLINLKSQFSTLDDDAFHLLTRKGVFPYDYVDDLSRLEETSLPARDLFYNKLSDSSVSENTYAHALNVWTKFNVTTLGEYSDLYLKTDVLLLADVFESFRDSCMKTYELDPAHYFTLPGFTWDAMLKHTNVKLELFTDVDMMLFVERGIRGGLSQCSHRYAKANNRYTADYDPSEPAHHIMYFDVNNLYGWAMSQPLPTHDFQWIEDAANFDVSGISENSSWGCILEVDLEYSRELHDSHADLPFCPTRDNAPGTRQEKLLATLNDKTRYVIHYRTLQQCMRHGLVLKRIHRGLRFQQSTWLATYIELNTRLRAASKNDFDKTLFKLMNNAVFGKTMENLRNRVDVKLVTKWEGRHGAEALISKPNFHSRAIFNENLVAIELSKLSIKFNKPIYVGMSILDISKTCLYEFHYDYMQKTFAGNCKILYTDTDSLIYDIQCEDMYQQMKRDTHRFDTSDYPVDNVYGMPLVNKKVPGLMKDENNGRIMTEFVGLRAKMYSFRVQNDDRSCVTKKAKGVKNYVIAKHISFEDYIDCLKNSTEHTRDQNCIRSKLHKVYSITQRKLALSPHDDKRYLVHASTATLPWGHYRISSH